MSYIYNYIGDAQPIPYDLYLGDETDVDLSLAIAYKVRLTRVTQSGSESIVGEYVATRVTDTQRITGIIAGGIVQRGYKYYIQSLVTFNFDTNPFPGSPIYFYVK